MFGKYPGDCRVFCVYNLNNKINHNNFIFWCSMCERLSVVENYFLIDSACEVVFSYQSFLFILHYTIFWFLKHFALIGNS